MFKFLLIICVVLIAIPVLEFLGIMFVATMYGLWYMLTYPFRWLAECARTPPLRPSYTPEQMNDTPIRYSRIANDGRDRPLNRKTFVSISPRTDPR